MVVFEKLTLRNSLFYKKLDLDLDYAGITVIYGDNRDANPGSTNAAGKSFALSQIPELLLESSPVSGKPEKGVGGQTSVYFRTKDHKYKVTRKKDNRTFFKIDGKDAGTLRKNYAKEKLRKIVPWSLDEFYSHIYIDSRRPNALQMGNSAARRAFLIQLFQLSNVDRLRKLFLVELRRVENERTTYEEVKRQRKTLSEQLISDSEISLEDRVRSLEIKYRTLSKRVHKATVVAELIRFKEENRKSIKRLTKILGEDSLEEVLEGVKARKNSLEGSLEKAVEWTAYKLNRSEYKKQAKPLQDKLQKYKDLPREDLSDNLLKFKRCSDSQLIVKRTIKETKKNLPSKKRVDKTLLDLDQISLQTELENSKKLLKTAEKFEDGLCPLCGHSVKIHNPKKVGKRIRILEKKLDKYGEQKDRAESNKKRKRMLETLHVLRRRKKKLSRRIRSLRPYSELAKLLELMPAKPKKFVGKRLDEERVRSKLSKVVKRLDFLNLMRPSLLRIKQCQKLKEEDVQESRQLGVLREELNKVVDKLPSLKSSLDKMRAVKQQISDLKDREDKLKTSVLDEEAYRILIDAYGNSGMKKMILKRIGKHLENKLNRYSRFVFSEDYKFKVRIETQLDILVERNYPGRKVVSDVRKLSGAETRQFILLQFLSLLSLIPPNRRTNLLILDEPDTNLGPEMVENLKGFLPVLNKIVPHIVILTPRTDIVYPGARVFTAIKEKGQSRLVTGKTL